MKFEHRYGEEAEGESVSVAPHIKPEVGENGVFTVEESDLLDRGVDPEASRKRLSEAGHTHLENQGQVSESSEAEEESGEGSEESEQSETQSEDSGEGASEQELLDLEYEQVQEIASSFDDVAGNQSHEELAEELAGRVVLEEK